MPKLLRNIEGSFADTFQGDIKYVNNISSVLKYNTNSIILPNFIALIQNLNEAIFVDTLTTPINYGIKQTSKTITVTKDGSKIFPSRYQTPTFENLPLINYTNTFSNSSSLCIFESPKFYVSGATKIIQETITCDVSGTDFNSMVLSAVTDCITTPNAEVCFNGITWELEIYSDNILSYSNPFLNEFTSATTINQGQVNNSIINALNNLNYVYSITGNTFTITKPKSVNEIFINLCVKTNIDDPCLISYSGCGCPTGFTNNIGNDGCIQTSSTTATYNGSTSGVTNGPQSIAYGQYGARFFTDITNVPIPLHSNSGIIYDGSGNTVTILSSELNSLWGDGLATHGRLNNVGVWTSDREQPFNEWIGFSYCLDIPTTGVYNIAVAGDNEIRFKINGNLIVDIEDGGYNYNFKFWSVFPYTFQSGLNIIEMYGLNLGSIASFGAEIYSATTAQLTGMTTTAQLSAVTIFSTLNEIGDTFTLGDTLGYSCPSGYTVNTCSSGTPICTKIIHTDFNTCDYSGNCNDICVVLSDSTFTGLTSGDTGVYIISSATTIDLDFVFTGDSESFIDNSASFKYEIYKYNTNSKIFNQPAIYESDLYTFDNLTLSALTQTIPVNILALDGEYLIKGYFIQKICTEYMSELGINDDTSYRKTGDEYGLYKDALDYYFIAFKEADVPVFTFNNTNSAPIGSLVDYTIFPDTDGQTEFLINVDYTGDILVALNGLVMSNGNDYTVADNILTISAGTYTTDVITIILVSNGSGFNGLTFDTYSINSPIVSGSSNNQGNNVTYYNTATNKYEVYSSVNLNTDIILTLNGLTLANNIDYYTSTSNKKRIILNGDLLLNDVINIYYRANTNTIGNITTNTPEISWYINNAPQNINGKFTIELANFNDTSFSNIIYSATTNYVINKTNYSLPLLVSGTVGTKYIYRVKNEKTFNTIVDDTLSSVKYSEVIPIQIQSNGINAY